MVKQIFQSRLLFGHHPSIMQSILSNGLNHNSKPPHIKHNWDNYEIQIIQPVGPLTVLTIRILEILFSYERTACTVYLYGAHCAHNIMSNFMLIEYLLAV